MAASLLALPPFHAARCLPLAAAALHPLHAVGREAKETRSPLHPAPNNAAGTAAMAEPGHVRYPLETTPAIPGRTASTDADKRAHVELMDFTSRRSPVLGTRGMVACTQPLAAEVG